VVVGAGLLGLATAYWLARGGLRPLVLERERPGAGATGRNGGFLPLGTAEDYDASVARLGATRARSLLGLTLENRRLADQLLTAEAIGCDLRPTGHLHLALSDEEQTANRSLASALTTDGCPTDWLDRSEAQRLVGTPFGPRIAGGLFYRGIATLHSGKLVEGLAAAAERHGARIVQGEVRSIERDGTVSRLQTRRGSIETPRVLGAVNAWTGTLLPAYRQLITPVRGQVLAFAPVPPVFASGMTALTTATEEYWQQRPDGSIILGGCRAVREDRDEGILSNTPTDEVQRALEGVLPGLFPAIGPLRVTHRWAGPMAFTPDRLPIVAPLHDDAGWIVGGFSGNGMSLGLILAKLVADLLLGRPADARLSLFAPDRFGGTAA
jgi:glycine/D-amino acid oxidase-like deaminating enzyme